MTYKTFQPSAASYGAPTQAVVVKQVPESIDPTQVDYTERMSQWQSIGSGFGTAGGGLVTSISNLIKGEAQTADLPPPVAEEEGVGATPWIVGGIALVGIVGAAWAFWPRD